jgi:hypothetical protein
VIKLGWLKTYVYNVLLSLDQLANALLGGDCDQSLSGRMGYALRNNPKWYAKWFAYLNDKFYEVFLGIKNHSVDAVEPEEQNKYETWAWYKKKPIDKGDK